MKARTGHTDFDADKQKQHRLGWGADRCLVENFVLVQKRRKKNMKTGEKELD